MNFILVLLLLSCLHSFVLADPQGDALYALRTSLNASAKQLTDWNPNQSFAPTSLVYILNQTDFPKILLIADINTPTEDTNQSYWEITSNSYFHYIKQYVVGIGPSKDTVVPAVNNYL